MASTELQGVRGTPAWRLKLAGFWSWWINEIARLVPERFAMGASRLPVLALEGDDVILLEPREVADPRISLIGLEDLQQKAAIGALLERAGETRRRARLALGRDEALLRRVPMPAATEENLAQVLGFEMDRLTPFRADDVYYDCRVISRDAAAAQILVQLAVSRRELVDARVERLRALGVNVQGVAVREDIGHGAPALDLLPSEQRGERESSRERMVQRSLLATVGALLVVALLLPVWQKREAMIALHPHLAKARQDAEATDKLSRDLEKEVADYNYLLTRKHGSYPVLAFIEEMTRLLPDNTWVQQFDVKPVGKVREVQVTGETASSSRLIELLEKSTLLQNAAPRGTVTRGSQPNTERFMIAAEARARPLPEARPISEMGTGAPVQMPQPAAVAAPPSAPAAPTPLVPGTMVPLTTTMPLTASPATPTTPTSPAQPATPPPATATVQPVPPPNPAGRRPTPASPPASGKALGNLIPGWPPPGMVAPNPAPATPAAAPRAPAAPTPAPPPTPAPQTEPER